MTEKTRSQLNVNFSTSADIDLTTMRLSIGCAVKLLREQCHMSTPDLSASTGMTQASIIVTEGGLRDLALHESAVIEKSLQLNTGTIWKTAGKILDSGVLKSYDAKKDNISEINTQLRGMADKILVMRPS